MRTAKASTDVMTGTMVLKVRLVLSRGLVGIGGDWLGLAYLFYFLSGLVWLV